MAAKQTDALLPKRNEQLIHRKGMLSGPRNSVSEQNVETESISPCQTPWIMVTVLLSSVIIIIFYLFALIAFATDPHGYWRNMSYLNLWNLCCIILYIYIIALCLVFAWDVTFSPINRNKLPKLYNPKKHWPSKPRNMRNSHTLQVIALLSVFELKWDENGIVCMLTVLYHICSSVLLQYQYSKTNIKDYPTDWNEWSYKLTALRWFFGAFALWLGPICWSYYYKMWLKKEEYQQQHNQPQSDTTSQVGQEYANSIASETLAYNQSIFTQNIVKYTFFCIFLSLLIQYQMMVVWNHQNYSQMIQIIYNCKAEECSNRPYFIINELILRIFCAWTILNLIIHIALLRFKEEHITVSTSYSKVMDTVSPSYLMVILFLIFIDIVIAFSERHYDNKTWQWFWISTYLIVILVMIILFCDAFSLRNVNQVEVYAAKKTGYLLHGFILLLIATIHTILLLVSNADQNRDGVSSGTWKQASILGYNMFQYILFCVLDPVRLCVKECKQKLARDIENFRINCVWRYTFKALCLLNVYNILYSFVFSIDEYYDLVNTDQEKQSHALFYLSYGFSFATSEFSGWLLFQSIDFVLNVSKESDGHCCDGICDWICCCHLVSCCCKDESDNIQQSHNAGIDLQTSNNPRKGKRKMNHNDIEEETNEDDEDRNVEEEKRDILIPTVK